MHKLCCKSAQLGLLLTMAYFEHVHNWVTGLSQSIGLATLSFTKPTMSDLERAEAHGNRFGFSWR